MRILHVSQPVGGGTARVVHDLATHQASLGHDVTVASPSSPDLAALDALGLRTRPWEATRSPGPSVVGEIRSLRRILRETAPDVVHLHSSKAGLVGRLATTPRRQPVVFQPHAWSFQASTGPLATLLHGWERLAAARTSHFVTVSHDELALGDFARAHHDVVHNGVDTDRFAPVDTATARRRLGLPDAPTVVCVGRVCRQKGQDLLLDRWHRVLEAVPDARLVLVGDGPCADEWRARWAHPSITWLGEQSDPRDHYNAADVVVVPSRWEAMALVPLEAMASGAVVVAGAVGGVRETLGDCGFVEDGPDAVVTRLVDVLSSCRAPGDPRARERAITMFPLAEARRRVLDVYATVTGTPAVPAL